MYCKVLLSVAQASTCDETKYGPSPPSLQPIAKLVKGTHKWQRRAKQSAKGWCKARCKASKKIYFKGLRCMHGVWAKTLRSNRAELGLGHIQKTVRATCKRMMEVWDKSSWVDKGACHSLLSGYWSNNMWMWFDSWHGWNEKEVWQLMWLEWEGSTISMIGADWTCNVLT